MVTRRVRERRFRLRPSQQVNQVIAYVLGVLAQRHGISLHALCWLSNHYHQVLTDTRGTICEFTGELHSFVARHVNQMHGDRGSLWSEHQTSRVEPQHDTDLREQIAYTMANPVEAFLVRYGHSWLGLRQRWPAPPQTYRKPPGFFRDAEDGGKWPEEVTLEFARPPGYDDLTDAELDALIQARVEERETAARDAAHAQRRPFLGVRAIGAQKRWHSPTTRERYRQISPRFASKDRHALLAAIERYREWHRRYNHALERFNAGERDVVFPYGTHQLRVLHNVNVAPGPD